MIELNIGFKIFNVNTKIINNNPIYSLGNTYNRIDAVKYPAKYLHVVKYEDKYELIIYFSEIGFHSNLDNKKFKDNNKLTFCIFKAL